MGGSRKVPDAATGKLPATPTIRGRPRRPHRSCRAPRPVALVLSVLLVCGLSVHPVFAQTSGSDPERDPERRLEEQRRASEAAGEAGARETLPDGDVSWEEVLADPDNIELNYRFALTQMREGEFRAAQATLERILMLAPDLPRARILYAIILYRLDNTDEAEREILAVMDLPMAAGLRARLRRYLDDIARRRQRTRFDLYTSVGVQLDWNRNQGPESSELETLFGRLPAGLGVRRQSDVAFQAYGRLGVVHDLPTQRRHRLFASVGWFRQEQAQIDRLDFDTVNVETGVVIDLAPVTLTPAAFMRHVRLNEDGLIDGYGGRLRLDWRLHRAVNLFAAVEGEAEGWTGVTGSSASGLRAGPEIRGLLGFDWIIDPTMRLSGSWSPVRKEARREFNSLDSHRLALRHTWLPGDGVFVLTGAEFEFDRYDAPDPLVDRRVTREDNIMRFTATVGAPLPFLLFGAELPDVLAGIVVSVTGEVLRSNSNLTNFKYWNRRFGLTVSRRWEF